MPTEQTNLPPIRIGKKIRFLRNQAGMTQDELAQELNVTRQALSNWERDLNMPDLDLLKKLCGIFGVRMDEMLMEVMHMEIDGSNINADIPLTQNDTKKPQRKHFNKYDMAIGLFYVIGLVLGIGIFFVGGFAAMTDIGWASSLFGGGCAALIFGMLAHAIITLTRKDR